MAGPKTRDEFPNPLAVLTTAALEALAAAGPGGGPDEWEPEVIWDLDRHLYRQSGGQEIKLAMHIGGLVFDPEDFTPDGTWRMDELSDEPLGLEWHWTPTAALMRGIGQMDPQDRFLIGCWTAGEGQMTAVPGGVRPVDEDWDGGTWTPAALETLPGHFANRGDVSGTLVVLLGEAERRLPATTEVDPDPADDVAGRLLADAAAALHRGLFNVPEEIAVRVVDRSGGGDPASSVGPDTAYVDIIGLRRVLDRALIHGSNVPTRNDKGLVEDIHWWDLDMPAADLEIPGNVMRVSAVVEHAAPAGEETWLLMRRFGIEVGFDRIVIAVEGNRPWSEATRAFTENFDEYLATRNEELSGRVRVTDPEALSARLREVEGVWTMLGHVEANTLDPEDVYLRAYARPQERPATEQQPAPSVVWISQAARSRPPDYLRDLAARYQPDENRLEINADFSVFPALVGHWIHVYAEAKGVDPPVLDRDGDEVVSDEYLSLEATVRAVVQEWCEQQLVEVVIGVNALAGTPGWDQRTVNKALSPESLSASAMAIYHVQQSIKRSLGQRLGSLKKEQIV